MYEYETSEQLFIDIWEKYGCPDEVYDSITIYNILNDLIVQSKHFVVLDHYSHINFDVIIKVEYDENNSLFKIYWQDNNKFRLAFIDHTLSDMDALQWEMFGFFTYEYFAIDIRKIKFVMVERHIFVLVQSNMITEKEMKKKIIGKNEIIDIERCTDKIYARYVFWEGDQNDLVKVSCIASNLPYFVCVIQPKENIPHTGISKKMLLVYTLDDIVERLKKVKMALLNEDLDRDELFAKGNTIRNIMEYTLKFFCVILDIPLNIEQKYGPPYHQLFHPQQKAHKNRY